MRRALVALAISHTVALLLLPLLFVAMVGWFVAEPPITLWDAAFTCDTNGVITGCYWKVPW